MVYGVIMCDDWTCFHEYRRGQDVQYKTPGGYWLLVPLTDYNSITGECTIQYHTGDLINDMGENDCISLFLAISSSPTFTKTTTHDCNSGSNKTWEI